MSVVWDSLYLLQTTAALWVPLIALSYFSMKYLAILGYRTTVSLGIVGVPLHELGHLISAVMLNHKIINFALFKPSIDGTLGYVSHSYRVSWFAPFANLIIGLAPLFAGMAGFLGMTHWLRPDLIEVIYSLTQNVFSFRDLLGSVMSLVGAVLSGGGFLNTLVWLLTSFSILLFCVPSKADFMGCRAGIITLAGLGLLSLMFFRDIVMHSFLMLEPYLLLVSSMLWSILVLMSLLLGLFLIGRYVVRSKIGFFKISGQKDGL